MKRIRFIVGLVLLIIGIIFIIYGTQIFHAASMDIVLLGTFITFFGVIVLVFKHTS